METTHILDKDTVCEQNVIIKHEGKLFCKIQNELGQSWEVMKNRITDKNTGKKLKLDV